MKKFDDLALFLISFDHSTLNFCNDVIHIQGSQILKVSNSLFHFCSVHIINIPLSLFFFVKMSHAYQ